MNRKPTPAYTTQISDSGRKSLTWIAEKLRGGFTGQIVLECNQGGVRTVKVAENLSPSDLSRARPD